MEQEASAGTSRRIVWQNAAVEVSEARRLVFMGYSFPAADFELRQLLARSKPHSARIDVVLKGAPSSEIERRYRPFFGRREIAFIPDGMDAYLTKKRWGT